MTTVEADATIDLLDQALADGGRTALLDRLCETLQERGQFRELLDALLLKARFELGLPAVIDGPANSLPDPQRTQYEDRYVVALRTVGRLVLDSGDLVGAWPYFRVIGEKSPIVEAIEKYTPEDGDQRVGHVIDVAFQQGVHPQKGFELILSQYGTCSAISSFEGLPPDEALRAHCAALLTRQLHEHLDANLRSEISRRGQPLPPAGAPLLALVSGKPWLFADDAYHIDVSHLASVVRMAPLLTDPAVIDLAIGLTDYGRNLSKLHRYEGGPPFDMLYEDHAVYLRALRGQGVDAAITHFRGKLLAVGDEDRDSQPAQVLVRLLVRLGRLDQAVDVAAEHLAGLPESILTCPSLARLCARAGAAEKLAQSARARGDLVEYATALVSRPEP